MHLFHLHILEELLALALSTKNIQYNISFSSAVMTTKNHQHFCYCTSSFRKYIPSWYRDGYILCTPMLNVVLWHFSLYFFPGHLSVEKINVNSFKSYTFYFFIFAPSLYHSQKLKKIDDVVSCHDNVYQY